MKTFKLIVKERNDLNSNELALFDSVIMEGASTWIDVRNFLEDGEAMSEMGISDDMTEAVESLHDFAVNRINEHTNQN